MRILIHSNAPWAATGYGQQTLGLAQQMVADGHAVAIASNYGLASAPMDWNGIPVLPQGYELYSNDIAPAHASHWFREEPGWVLSLYDAWVFQPEAWERVPHFASWVPVDHAPVPPRVLDWCRRRPDVIAMSRFGQEQLAKGGVKSTYIPHSIDTEAFKARDTLRNGRDPRTVMRVDRDAFVVTITAANKGHAPSRKAFPEMFLALAQFMRKHADAQVYMHTEPFTPIGMNLGELVELCGIPADRVKWVDQYAYRMGMIGQEDLAAVYTASDVLLATSRGEGFGIPVIEAQACGTPVIVTNFSAQPELLGAGWLVNGQPDFDEAQRSWYVTPRIAEIVEALEAAYGARGDADLAERARQKALEYSTAKVYPESWRPYLASLEAKLKQPVPHPMGNRAARRAARKRAA